jgi:hypothetical protein
MLGSCYAAGRLVYSRAYPIPPDNPVDKSYSGGRALLQISVLLPAPISSSESQLTTGRGMEPPKSGRYTVRSQF